MDAGMTKPSKQGLDMQLAALLRLWVKAQAVATTQQTVWCLVSLHAHWFTQWLDLS